MKRLLMLTVLPLFFIGCLSCPPCPQENATIVNQYGQYTQIPEGALDESTNYLNDKQMQVLKDDYNKAVEKHRRDMLKKKAY